MKPIRIAIVSDLHVGTAARTAQFCPPKYNPQSLNILNDSVLSKFERMVTRECLAADFLLLPGDVTNKADPDEVALASDIIGKIAATLCVPSDNIAFVPGNHDVDWSVLQNPDSQGVRWKQRFDPVKLESSLFAQSDSRGTATIFETPFFNLWNYKELIVLGYNTAHADRPNADHYGLIDTEHLEPMQQALDKLTDCQDKPKILLLHHHPQQISDPSPDEPDFSILVNAENLLKFASRNQFDILVHGHRHLPYFQTISKDNGPPLAVLCSGSFSIDLPQKWRDCVRNQFHLIDIKGRDSEHHMLYGEVRSWAYGYNDGWQPSVRRFAGIDARECFGSSLLPSALDKRLRESITFVFSKQDFVRWDTLVQFDPILDRARSSTVLDILRKLTDLMQYDLHGESLETLILTKRKI